MKKRIGQIMLCFLVICGLLAGCGKTQEDAPDGQAAPAAEDSASTDQADTSNEEATADAASGGVVYQNK